MSVHRVNTCVDATKTPKHWDLCVRAWRHWFFILYEITWRVTTTGTGNTDHVIRRTSSPTDIV